MGFFNTILAGSNALKMLGLGVHNLLSPVIQKERWKK